MGDSERLSHPVRTHWPFCGCTLDGPTLPGSAAESLTHTRPTCSSPLLRLAPKQPLSSEMRGLACWLSGWQEQFLPLPPHPLLSCCRRACQRSTKWPAIGRPRPSLNSSLPSTISMGRCWLIKTSPASVGSPRRLFLKDSTAAPSSS